MEWGFASNMKKCHEKNKSSVCHLSEVILPIKSTDSKLLTKINSQGKLQAEIKSNWTVNLTNGNPSNQTDKKTLLLSCNFFGLHEKEPNMMVYLEMSGFCFEFFNEYHHLRIVVLSLKKKTNKYILLLSF